MITWHVAVGAYVLGTLAESSPPIGPVCPSGFADLLLVFFLQGSSEVFAFSSWLELYSHSDIIGLLKNIPPI